MPYLEPERVLREFSRYALAEIRPALADDEQFIRGQVGSMASTLRFLAGELEGIDAGVDSQRDALEAALADATEIVNDAEVEVTLTRTHEEVATADGSPREMERTLLDAADEALTAIDGLPPEEAREARRPLYTFLDARLAAQHRLLGRPDGDG